MKKIWRLFLKYFVPQGRNDYRPYFLRREMTTALLLLVLLVEGVFLINAFFDSSRGNFLGAVLPGVLVSLTNDERGNEGIKALSQNLLLEKAAQAKAEDMATRGYFSHKGPNGEEPWIWLDKAGYGYSYAGENLAVNFSESADVSLAWKNSPAHWKNIINERFAEVGIGIAEGIYKGEKATFVVQFFGTPSVVLVPAEKTPVTLPITEVFSGEAQGAASFNSSVSLADKVLSSPRFYTNRLLMGFLGLIIAGLALAIFIKFHIQHAVIIGNGALLLGVVAGVLMLNNLYFKSSVELPAEFSFASTISSR